MFASAPVIVTPKKPNFGTGRDVLGYNVPVINEQEARGSAGLLFVFGLLSYANALQNQDPNLLKPFGIFFMIDMMLRVGLGEKWSPSLMIASLIVRKQQPVWVGAPQKEAAWWMGLGMALTACMSMGLLGLPPIVPFILCGFCVVFMFLETAFGMCVGCMLYAKFSRTAPQHCPGGVCPHPTEPKSPVD